MKRMLAKGFFRLARCVSMYSYCKIRVGAVISKKSPLRIGFNIIKTHPIYNTGFLVTSVSIHAEMRALINAGHNVEGCDIYVYRETSDGDPALARPCSSCYNVLKSYGIRKIYYTVGEPPFWKCEKL